MDATCTNPIMIRARRWCGRAHGRRRLDQSDWYVGGCDGATFLRRPWICVGVSRTAREDAASFKMVVRHPPLPPGTGSLPRVTESALARPPFYKIPRLTAPRDFLLAQHFPSIKILTLENDFREEISSRRRSARARARAQSIDATETFQYGRQKITSEAYK